MYLTHTPCLEESREPITYSPRPPHFLFCSLSLCVTRRRARPLVRLSVSPAPSLAFAISCFRDLAWSASVFALAFLPPSPPSLATASAHPSFRFARVRTDPLATLLCLFFSFPPSFSSPHSSLYLGECTHTPQPPFTAKSMAQAVRALRSLLDKIFGKQS